MKTTELIRQWSMSGAGRDIAGHFRSDTEIREALATRVDKDRPRPARAHLLVKRVDKDDWMPLATR